ncbi:PspC domain-containing protein [Pseudoalteromonas xiamenensis]|uniref:PspC domain-containing protein n=1 Tax=Pseudoalteromonas xiamenensis TaxID=882626 RepID=UPI0027E574F5|nr:PspC domain-containing protein [Pseudoalteromonas xiamenensis]WMN58391.1 PspC domain-containing protein [Pseudoalteromonas xiamenensis]
MSQFYQKKYQRMTRNLSNKKLAGVCSGFAERFDMPVWLVRLLTLLVFFKFPVLIVIAYGLAACCLPTKTIES